VAFWRDSSTGSRATNYRLGAISELPIVVHVPSKKYSLPF